MSWNLEGSYAETCSRELMCPCNLTFDHGATYDYCRATLAFDIRRGEVEGTDVGGRRVVAIIDTPKVMTEGNWRVGMFVDDQASDTCVGPTSSTVTTGLVGAVGLAGNVTVTGLLEPERFPAASLA